MLEWFAVAGLVVCWSFVYRFSRCVSTKPECQSRVVALVFAVIVINCSVCTVYYERNGILIPGQPNPPLASVVCILSLSYFIFDFLWILICGEEGPVMVAHHILCIVIFAVTLVKGTCASEVSSLLMLAELSNPYLQYRYFVRNSVWKHSWSSCLVTCVFIFMYFLCRMVLMPQALWLYINNPESDTFTSIVGATMYAISWIWWIVILRTVCRKILGFLRS